MRTIINDSDAHQHMSDNSDKNMQTEVNEKFNLLQHEFGKMEAKVSALQANLGTLHDKLDVLLSRSASTQVGAEIAAEARARMPTHT